jgi:Protein of unknown function (DUF3551)
MRRMVLTVLVLGALSAPASAQTYGNSSFPVCLQVYGRFSQIDCSYSSIGQCQASAQARAAQCIVNPYYAPAGNAGARVRHRHHYRHGY